MENLRLLIDLHRNANRQGPGGEKETEKAIELALLDCKAPLKIADIGCGTGASTLTLARLTHAHITAVDFLQEFLDELKDRADTEGLSKRITPLCVSMDNLPFESEEFDVIWSEGAIYNIGFKNGITQWSRYLKPGGTLVVSEINWTTATRCSELEEYWQKAYAEIDMPSAKIKLLEDTGYSLIGYFLLPQHCWLQNYYMPLQNNFENFLNRHGNCEEARHLVEIEREEIEFYNQYNAHYGYGVYIARKI